MKKMIVVLIGMLAAAIVQAQNLTEIEVISTNTTVLIDMSNYVDHVAIANIQWKYATNGTYTVTASSLKRFGYASNITERTTNLMISATISANQYGTWYPDWYTWLRKDEQVYYTLPACSTINPCRVRMQLQVQQ
jgi:hypothetical protein